MSEESGEPTEEALGTGLRRLTAPRHSAAALRWARSRGGRRSILVALMTQATRRRRAAGGVAYLAFRGRYP